MFRSVPSALDADGNAGNDLTRYTDDESRQQRWGSIIDKIEVNFAESVNEDERPMVQFQKATASSTTDDYFSALSAPGMASHFQPAARFGRSCSTFSRRKLTEWIQLQKMNTSRDISDRKKYFERSVRILHSLVLKMIIAIVKAGKTEMVVAVHPDIITSENIMVHHSAEDGETAHFIQSESMDGSSLDGLATKYCAMKALGMVAYELLMMGDGHPVSFFLPSVPSDIGGTHLQLSICGIGECIGAEAHERNQADAKAPRTAVDKTQGRITNVMLNSGVPYPLCRFVVDLLGEDCSDGLLLRSDNSFASFSDILSDLKQMINNPEAFIHLSVRDQWRLAFGNKMHGRESEKKMIMDAASRTTGTTSNDALFEALSLLLPQNKRQIVMVSGKPGSGKSRLVMEAKTDLENKGWIFLSCKFDRIVHAEPLSVMASAFDEFLEQCLGSSRQPQISTNLKTLMLPNDVSILTTHVPCLVKYLDGPPGPVAGVEVSKEEMHQLFHQLLHVLSVAGQPIAFFADDLQWADAASIDLFVALSEASEPVLSRTHCDTHTKSKIMLIGSYRDDEVHSDHLLADTLRQLKSRNSSFEVTDIAVRGFSLETLNQIVSESLCLPLRRTKFLTEIILQKTDGIVIHIIELIGRLTMDRILCHSFVKGWEWDSEVIEGYPISDSVAELFVFKLNKLPLYALRALQICSIFGTQIEQRVISFVQDFDGEQSVDIIAGLKDALALGLIEMTDTTNVFKFAHDIIAQAAFDLISDDERSVLLRKLASALIRNASAANEIDRIIFVAVDLVNRIKNDVVTDPEERVLYACMNEKAGKKALAVPDFSSAVKYSESGLAFLDVCHWNTHHELTMSLHQTSVAALYSCPHGNRELLKERIEAVFRRSKTLDEEFKTRHVWIRVLSTTSLEEAIEACHALLERLEEPIDLSKYSSSHLYSELVRAKDLFSEKRQQFSMMSPMADLNKRNAMKIMSSLIIYYHQQSSNFAGLVSSRMVETTIKYGYCEESVFAVASFAATIVRVLGDIDEGSSWARMALSLLTRFRHNVNALLPAVYAAVYGLVLILTEPIQASQKDNFNMEWISHRLTIYNLSATLSPLLRGCSLAFDYGSIQFAVGNAEVVNVLLGEIDVLAHKCAQHCQLPAVERVFAPLHHVLRDLKGLDQQALAPLGYVYDTSVLQDSAYGKKDLHNLDTQLMIHIAHAFMLGDMKKVQSLAEMFEDLITKKHFVFNCVIIEFYAGLAACQFARETLEKGWEDKAEQVRESMEKMCSHSKWNFENKYLLIRAECHYTKGNINAAAECYESSIISARNHKLVHEEAVACELAGNFFREQGDKSKSHTMFGGAHKAYMNWGAVKKAKTLPQA
eukprot:CCRYP_016431-RD/>CCRYP_016431-RD protein AED:0.05 eAED:0.05 QI:491/0.6/0.5/1/0.2/0.16/6/0/1361